MEGVTSGGNSYEGSSNGESLPRTVEIKIKTLDSQVYTCQVQPNIPVPALKEQIASLTGVPAENQRLICRGKVLKDDHLLSAYNVEDGHTLHLVTRQAPQPDAPSSSAGVSRSEGVGEDQGPPDSLPAALRNRPGQVSHSVVLGTFNIPDHGDGGMPDVSRIVTSVLNSLGIGNLVQANAGANNGASVTATILPTAMQPPVIDAQERSTGTGGRPQAGVEVDARHQSLPSELGGSRDMEPQYDSVPALRPSSGFVGAIPATAPQIRLVQQAMVVPDALTTMSQYLHRLEQVFATNGQQQGQAPNPLLNSSAQASSSVDTQHTALQAPPRAYPTPAALGVIIRRALELLSHQAGSELARLASQLENEPNLADGAARGEVQSAALRDGILMQHLGALLLELGRTTLTLRMGASPVESAVNAGPAVFISPSGPNPMMVQPLPFQPGAGFGALTGGTAQATAGAMGPPLGASEAPRNINIHIHASDSGLASGVPSALPFPSQVPLPTQSGVMNPGPSLGSSTSDTGVTIPIQAPVTVASDRPPSGYNVPLMQNVPGSLQGGSPAVGEQGTVRVVPMRTLVAAVPTSLHNRPPTEAAGASVGVFYPLLARFQQLSPSQFSQQVGPSRVPFLNGAPAGLPVRPGTSVSQQPSTSVSPTIQAQVQVQAWVPSAGQPGDGQGGSRPVRIDGTLQLPFTSSAQETASFVLQQQQSLNGGTGLVLTTQGPLSQPAPVAVSTTSNMVTASGAGEAANGEQASMPYGIDVAGLVRPILQVVEAYQQVGVGRANQSQSGQPVASNETAPHVDGANVAVRDSAQEHGKEAQMNEIQVLDLQKGESNITASSSSGRKQDKLKLQGNGAANVPAGLGLGGLQPLPSRTHKKPHKQQGRQQAAGTSGHAIEVQTTSSESRGDEPVVLSSRGQNSLHDFLSSVASRSEDTGAIGTGSGQIPPVLTQLLNGVGNRGQLLGGGNVNIGELLSQVVTNPAVGNPSAAAARDPDQGVPLPSGALGSIMGQVMQSPFMRNVLQQVVEQVGEEPQGFEDMLSQSMSGQGGLNLSGMFQQMMPIVAQALGRATTSGSEQASSLVHGTEIRSREDGGAMVGTGPMNGSEQVREESHGFEDMLSLGSSSQGGLNLLQQMMPVVAQALGRGDGGAMGGTGPMNGSEQVREESHGFEDMLPQGLSGQGGLNLLQQMMPVVAQALGRPTASGSEQASSQIHSTETRPRQDVGAMGVAGPINGPESWKQAPNQDDLPHGSGTISDDVEQQQSMQMQRPSSELYSGGPPVAKRQKIDVERTVQKLEQDDSPEEIVRAVAESAAILVAPSNGAGVDVSNLAEHLSQVDGLANDYMALLLRDLTTHVTANP